MNEGIVSALKSICINPSNYPPIFLSKIKDNKLTFKMIRILVAKTYIQIEQALTDENIPSKSISKNLIKPRGKQGGASKKSATFKVKDPKESDSLQRLLLSRFPEIKYISNDNNEFKSLEGLLHKIKEIAIKEIV